MNNKQTEAMLFVARETEMITITDVAVTLLESAGFTPAEIQAIVKSVIVSNVAPKNKVVQNKNVAPKKKTNKRQNSWSRWTTEDDNTIESLWANGFTVTQIAKKMKRSTQAVNSRIALLRATGSRIEYRNLGVRDARLNGSPKNTKFTLPKK